MQETLPVVLDIDCITSVTASKRNTIAGLLDAAHETIETIFESFLTDDLRSRLDEQQEQSR
jgi:uncharacterized protein (TIGR04255 family)